MGVWASEVGGPGKTSRWRTVANQAGQCLSVLVVCYACVNIMQCET